MTTTKDVFDRIAPGWYNYRHWTIFRKELEGLAQRWQQGRLLNVGCGHGPDFLPFKNNFELYGVDFSPEMLKLARKYAQKHGYKVSLAEADFCQLPYEDNYFDQVIAVAAYHHVKGKEERLGALWELCRVLKPGSEVFITVWNKWQPRFWFSRKEVSIPWRSRTETLYRYYYLFSYGELAGLARKAGFTVLALSPESRYRLPIKYFSRNICLLAKKAG